MFLSIKNSGYDRYGQQFASGRFLVLVQPKLPFDVPPSPIRAIVRYTRMEQCGNFVMGSCRAFGHSVTLSGDYGNDGLSRTVPDVVYDRATPVPAELIEAWNTGRGWNSAGSEAAAMRQWAVETFNAKKPV